MLLVVRKIVLFTIIIFQSQIIIAKDLYLLVVGQSISANCNQHMFLGGGGIFQIDRSGKLKPASDPFDWADCGGGSMWIPLGEKLIASGMADKVVFMPIGVAGVKASDWNPGGKAFGKLNDALAVIKYNQIKFDYAFWHQGSSDINSNPDLYMGNLSRAVKFIAVNAKIDKWIIAQHSSCFGNSDAGIAKIQRDYATEYIFNRFPGPDTNQLGNEYRFDECHLNKKGQEKMAQLWFDSLINAEKISKIIQRESLLYFFK